MSTSVCTKPRTCLVCGSADVTDSKDGVTCGDSICVGKLPETITLLRDGLETAQKEIEQHKDTITELRKQLEERESDDEPETVLRLFPSHP